MPYPAVPEVYFRTPLSESYSSTNLRYMSAVVFSIALLHEGDAQAKQKKKERVQAILPSGLGAPMLSAQRTRPPPCGLWDHAQHAGCVHPCICSRLASTSLNFPL